MYNFLRWALTFGLWLPMACAAAAFSSGGPAALHASHQRLTGELAHNDYQRALHVASSPSPDDLRGDVYAVLDHPFALVGRSLGTPSNWCEMLILPYNTKYCRAAQGPAGPQLVLRVGHKSDQPVEQAYPLVFDWHPVVARGDFFEARLTADNGPLGTNDYQIVVAAVPLDGRRTFVHLRYSYRAGFAGNLAMQGYLATVGAGKVGFTVMGRQVDGSPVLIDGVRGVVERNAMRYYLAIDAYLDSLAGPPAGQVERRIQGWFTASARHARQLNEMDRATYVVLKRAEHQRQQAALP